MQATIKERENVDLEAEKLNKEHMNLFCLHYTIFTLNLNFENLKKYE